MTLQKSQIWGLNQGGHFVFRGRSDVFFFNCALCVLIPHLTFQMRKVLVTRNINQTISRFLHRRVWTAGHETTCTIRRLILELLKQAQYYNINHTYKLSGNKMNNKCICRHCGQLVLPWYKSAITKASVGLWVVPLCSFMYSLVLCFWST